MFDDLALRGTVARRDRVETGLVPAWRSLESERRYLREVALLVLAYYVAAHLGYAFAFSGPVASLVWLPVGVGAAFLYLRGLRFWPGVVIGDLLVNSYSTLPLGSALAQSAGNLLEVLLIVVLVRRLCPREDPISTVRGVAGMVAAIACGTLMSATVGSLASWLGGVIATHSVPYVWRTWWLGDFSGALIVLPLALSWSRLPPRPWHRSLVLEALVALGAVSALSALQLEHATLLCALVFPALIWAALRFGSRGAALAITIVCAFAILGATNRLGPFGVGSINSRLLETQLFIATVSLSALAIAALVAERAQLEDGVRASRARLVASSDDARRQLERDLHDGAQQDLIGLRLKLARAAELIPHDSVEGERQVSVIGRQMDDVLEHLRTIVTGVYPPILHEGGIAAALGSAANRSALPVRIQAAHIHRHPESIERAVYFCCLEALQNVAKHAGDGVEATVQLREEPAALMFEVTDSGMGFDVKAVRAGSGLANMRDRIEAVGGSLSISSERRNGTFVRGRVPLR